MTVQFVLLLVSSSLCYDYYDYYDDQFDKTDLQYVSHETLTVIHGSSFTVICRGDHSSELQLFHNEVTFTEEKNYNASTHSYLISSAREDHTGTWTCGDATTHLAVIPGLERTAIILGSLVVEGEGRVVTVREGDVLQPVCVTASSTTSSLSDRPPAHWRLGGQTLNKTEVLVRLDEAGREHVVLSMEVMEARREQNQAKVECSLQGVEASLVLEVEYPPQFTISRQPNFGTPVVSRSSVSLLCTVDSWPLSDVFWERDGQVVSTSVKLSLAGVTVEDQGWYQCNANHKLGNYSSVGYYLAIKEAEDIKIPPPCPAASSDEPSVMTPLHNISTTRGHNVTIYSKYCSALPLTQTFWSGPNILVRQGDTSGRFRTAEVGQETETCTTVSLVIGAVETSDTGLYLLVVVSEAGAGQGRVWLEVGPGEEKRLGATSGGGRGLVCDTLIFLVVTLLLPFTCYVITTARHIVLSIKHIYIY